MQLAAMADAFDANAEAQRSSREGLEAGRKYFFVSLT
jgi:hypothetical protein